MIVVHFESGLGNQMLNYTEYLAVSQSHPNEEIYMENIIFELGREQNKINMWNGYELERIFNIKIRNISELFSAVEWEDIVNEVKESNFWNENWDYSSAICNALRNHGVELNNFASSGSQSRLLMKDILIELSNTRIGYWFKRQYGKIYQNRMIEKKSMPEKLFLYNEHDFYTGQNLLFMYKKNEIEKIKTILMHDFRFPPLDKDSQCALLYNQIIECESVGVHVRRSDMLYANGYLYKYGYFKRAVKLVRDRVHNPIFFIFGDNNSTDWVKKNPQRIGLRDQDKIVYVECNKGKDSYRDMQLLTVCRCVIITNSSFGWWGAFLNNRPNKITISPFANYNTTDWV